LTENVKQLGLVLLASTIQVLMNVLTAAQHAQLVLIELVPALVARRVSSWTLLRAVHVHKASSKNERT